MIIHEGVNELNVQMQLITGVLSGVVTDAVTGAALAGVTVNLDGVIKTTGADGSYRFLAVPPGTYTVTFAKAGYVTQTF